MTGQQPTDEFARGADDLMSVLAEAAEQGAREEMILEGTPEEPLLRCRACGRTTPPASVERIWTRRLEGASDPADEMIVMALRCPECGESGVLVLPFGPQADPLQDAALRAMSPD